ncbi:MAG: tryptophan-rich sensory protein [Oscillospiraceae bacterium]|nr:tryptophan-rich sensory protein [Oscillospiraceae bacterium]
MDKPDFRKQAAFWIGFSLAVGGAATFLTRKGLAQFDLLQMPALTPPRIVFPIAWSILLILIGLGFALVRRKGDGTAAGERAEIAYAVQMTFFFCWMIWFFGLGWYGFSALWLVGLIVSVIAMTALYRRISRTAAWMQVPYLLWCCFALYLNIGVWRLNG